MKIYIDIIFLKNLIINFFIFEIMDIILQKKSKMIKKTIIAICASASSIIILLINPKQAVIVVSQLLFSIIIVTILYNSKKSSDVIKDSIILYTITFFLGGIMSSIINEVVNIDMSIYLAIIICIIVVSLFKSIIKDKYKKIKNECHIKIIINEKTINANVLIDTGNHLQDIMTGDTVIILNKEKIEEISETLYKTLQNVMMEIPEEYQTKIRIVEYSSLGNENDFLCGIKADCVEIYIENMVLENKNVIVAASKTLIKEYDGLVSEDLIEGGMLIGNSSIVKT